MVKSRRESAISLFSPESRKKLSTNLARSTKKIFSRKRTNVSPTKRAIAMFLISKTMTFIMLPPTLFMLFVDDIVGASGCDRTSGLLAFLFAFKLIIFLMFVVEMIASVYAREKEYVFSVIFVLDLVALLSLVPDMAFFISGADTTASLNQLSITRVARTARLATRLARMGKILAIMDCTKRSKDVEQGPSVMEPSRVGYRLISRTTTKVIVLVLLMLLLVTLCTPGPSPTPHAVAALTAIQSVFAYNRGQPNSTLFATSLAQFSEVNTVLYLELLGTVVVNYQDIIDRTQSLYLNQYWTTDSMSTVIYEDKSDMQLISGLAIVETFLIIVFLAAGCLLINRDAIILVIRPLEKMLGLIKKLTVAMATKTGNSSHYEDSDSDDDGAGKNKRDDGDSDDETSAETSAISFGGSDEEFRWKEKENEIYAFGEQDSDLAETDALVDIMDRLTQNQIDSVQMKRHESHKKHSHVIIAAAIQGYFARKRINKIKEGTVRRNKLVQELLSSEKVYVNGLSTLINVFVHPLRELELLEADVMEIIFGHLDGILEYNKNLLYQFENRLSKWHMHQIISDIFLRMSDMTNVYSAYVNNYNEAINVLAARRQKDHALETFLEDQMNGPCNGLDVTSYLIMPIQRLPRYVMLLEQLQKCTPSDHPDARMLSEAVEIVKEVTNNLNERKRQAENQKVVQDYYISVEPPVELLTQSDCQFISKGQILREGEEHVGLLFSNVFILARPKNEGHNYGVIGSFPLKHTNVVSICDSEFYGLTNAFQVEISKSEKMLLSAAFPSQKTTWVDNLTAAIKNRKEAATQRKATRSPSTMNNHSPRLTLSASSKLKSSTAKLFLTSSTDTTGTVKAL